MTTRKLLYWVAAGTAAEAWRRYETESIRLLRVDAALPRWPAHLNGFRVLVVSDMHVRRGAKSPGRREKRLSRILKDIACDVLLVPGDCGNTRNAVRVAVNVLRSACPRYGTYITLGNGENKPWADTQGLVKELQHGGRVLMNESARIDVNGHPVWIAGVDDPFEDKDRLSRALAGIPEGEPVILLAHTPEIVTRLHRATVDLAVCGHTHGGQVCRPDGTAIWTQMSLQTRDALGAGLYLPVHLSDYNKSGVGDARLFVSRGVGTARLPIRLHCRPEIALLTLHSAE